MGDRAKLFAGLAAGALVLGGVAFLLLRPGAAVNATTDSAAPLASRARRCKVHNRSRLPLLLQPFATWWEENGEFDLQVPTTGGDRYDTGPGSQPELYAMGRTAPGKIVTEASTAADSAHGHSGAGDLHPVRALDSRGGVLLIYLGTEADPNVRDEALRRFGVMGRAAEALGFEWGGRFPKFDGPHIQVKGWRSLPVAIRPLGNA